MEIYGRIHTYTDGSIPYYNLENEEQGWYNQNTGKQQSLNGKYQILDIKDEKIIIRDYSDAINKQDIILDNTGKVIFKAKEINILEDGYIIKSENNKLIYINERLNSRTTEFDYINDLYIKEGVLICVNKNGTNLEYKMLNLKGELLTNQIYDIIGNEDDDLQYMSKSYILDSVYQQHYINNE